MRVRFIPFAVVVVLLVAACDGSGPDPARSSLPGPPPVATLVSGPGPSAGPVSIPHSGPPQPIQPSVPADVPTTGPNLLRKGERPPVMPLEATQHTSAGAVAFASFFIRTIDWAYATTSTAYMRHYFTANCVTCKSIQAGIDDARARGRHFIGDRLTITGTTDVASPIATSDPYTLTTVFSVTSGEVVDSKGSFVDGLPALRLRNQTAVVWLDDSWIVVDLVALK